MRGNLNCKHNPPDYNGYKVYGPDGEQEKPDPNFSTVAYPNPEDPAAFELAIRLGKKVDAQIIIATVYGLTTWDTLTDFKFIGHKIKEMEEEGSKQLETRFPKLKMWISQKSMIIKAEKVLTVNRRPLFYKR